MSPAIDFILNINLIGRDVAELIRIQTRNVLAETTMMGEMNLASDDAEKKLYPIESFLISFFIGTFDKISNTS